MNSLNPEIFHATHFSMKSSSHLDKTHSITKQFKKPTYAQFEHIWSYGGKICLLIRHSLNTLANNAHVVSLAGKNFTQNVSHITTRLKILSIISVFFNLKNLKTTAQKIIKDIFSKNLEEISLNTLSFTIISADIVDSITTFINAILTLSSATPVSLLSSIGKPLAIIISSFGTVSRTIQIAKSLNLYKKIDNTIKSEKNLDKNSLKAFLEEVLGISQELKNLMEIPSNQQTHKQLKQLKNLKERNKAAILRAAPIEAVKDLENLLSILSNDDEEILSIKKQDAIFNILKNIQKHLIKKVKVNLLGILANLFTLTAITLFTITSLSSFPFALITISFAIRLASLFYQDQKTFKPNLRPEGISLRE